MGLEPYFDYEKLTAAMVVDLSEVLTEQMEAHRSFWLAPNARTAERLFQSLWKVESTVERIQRRLATQPVLVHVAGEAKVEWSPDNPVVQALVQRCARCGSVLHFACAGVHARTHHGNLERTGADIPWWPPGTVVAEHGSEREPGMSAIADRRLNKHELECPALHVLEAPRELKRASPRRA